MEWAVDTTLACSAITHVCISTDDDWIPGQTYDPEVAIQRQPAHLATDAASTEGVARNVLGTVDTNIVRPAPADVASPPCRGHHRRHRPPGRESPERRGGLGAPTPSNGPSNSTVASWLRLRMGRRCWRAHRTVPTGISPMGPSKQPGQRISDRDCRSFPKVRRGWSCPRSGTSTWTTNSTWISPGSSTSAVALHDDRTTLANGRWEPVDRGRDRREPQR